MLNFFRLSIVNNLKARRDKIKSSRIETIKAKRILKIDPNLIWMLKTQDCKSTSREYTNNHLQEAEEADSQLVEVANNKYTNKKSTKNN